MTSPEQPLAGPPRTFKLRRGRITAHQAAGLSRLGPMYGLAVEGALLDPAAEFGRRAPLVLEIGFGMGEATVAMAAADPQRDVMAVDVHTPGVGRLLRDIESHGLTNVRVVEGDALALLRGRLARVELDEVRVFFPDPWPKARHAKRRLISPEVLDLIAARLRVGGVLHVATDWEPYARMTEANLSAHIGFDLEHFGARPAHRPVTRFERRAISAGRSSYDLIAVRRS